MVECKSETFVFFPLSGSRNLKNESFVTISLKMLVLLLLSHGLHFSRMN